MAKFRFKRQGATSVGVRKRLDDTGFGQISDVRQASKVQHPLPGLLKLLVVSLCSGRDTQRGVEDCSEELRSELCSVFGLNGRVPDNVIGGLLPRLSPTLLRASLHRIVKAEHKRGNLKATLLKYGTAAIDGKALATLREADLRRVLPEESFVSDEALRAAVKANFGAVQMQVQDDGQRYFLTRVHRTTLISSSAAVAIDQQPIAGDSNEVGSIVGTLRNLHRTYGRTSLFELFTMDAGNCSLDAANWCADTGYDYLMGLKDNQPHLNEQALRLLGDEDTQVCEPLWRSAVELYQGRRIRHEVRAFACPDGILQWGHARQLLRVRRTVKDPDGNVVSVGNRYFITSMPIARMDAEEAAKVVRAHWRCENEQHWTADMIWSEDARRTPLSRHPIGLLVVSILRLVAMCINAVLRSLSRIGDKKRKPPWRDVQRYIDAAFFTPCLPAGEFHAFDDSAR